MKLILSLIIVFFTSVTFATDWQVDALDLQDGRTQLIITDRCGEKFIEIFRNDDLKKGKGLDWLNMLLKSKEVDKCIDSD